MPAQRILWGVARAGWSISHGILALLWGVRGEWPWAVLAAIFGVLAIVNSYGRRAWVASISFIVLLALSGVATLWNSWAAFGSVLSGLIAWDTELFARRLELFSDPPNAIVWAHLKRLGAIALLSGALGAGALSFTVSLGFGWILLIAFGFLVAFSLLLRQGLS